MSSSAFERHFPAVKQTAIRTMFLMVLFLPAFCGSVVFIPAFIVMFWLQLPSARRLLDTIISIWFSLAVALFEYLCGVEIEVRGDVEKLNADECNLILMNHRTRVDWLFLFSLQARYASLRRFKISLKEELKHLPGFGWAMQFAQFLFLKRKWEKDREWIEYCLNHFKHMDLAPQLLLFPEGTDFREDSKEKSNEYARRNGLEEYDYVLHPRTTGFMFFFNYMKTHNKLSQVIDVTIAYPNNDMLQKETDLAFGANLPKKIIFTVKCFGTEDIPADNEPNLACWLEEVWRDKERFLKDFYEEKHYREDPNKTSMKFKNSPQMSEFQLYLIGAVMFWGVFLLLVAWYLIISSWFRWYFLMSLVMCIVTSTFYGFDYLFPTLMLR